MTPTSRAEGNQPKHLVSVYNQVSEGEIPLNFTGDIDYIVNKDKYEMVISNAHLENTRLSYSLTLRPWQRDVVNALSNQSDRKFCGFFISTEIQKKPSSVVISCINPITRYWKREKHETFAAWLNQIATVTFSISPEATTPKLTISSHWSNTSMVDFYWVASTEGVSKHRNPTP
jgi:hypothetical protein